MTETHIGGLNAFGIGVDVIDEIPEKSTLAQYQVVIPWSHGWEADQNQYELQKGAMAFIQMAQEAGLPVFSAIPSSVGHDQCYIAWGPHGLCPKHQRIKLGDKVELSWPVLVRASKKMSQGMMIYQAGTQREVDQLLQSCPDLDLAVEYVDVRSEDGLYRKYRSYVVGDSIIPRQVMISRDWKVTLQSTVGFFNSGSPEENKRFLSDPDPERDALLLKAAKLVGLDAGAIDFSFRSDGSLVVWEINACYGMAGKGRSTKDIAFRRATGLTEEDVLEREQQLGFLAAKEILFRSLRRKQSEVVSVLWSGGWDSTFRIIQLLEQGKTVLPIYIAYRIDVRANTTQELDAMAKLRLHMGGYPGELLQTLVVGNQTSKAEGYGVPMDSWVHERAQRIGYGGSGGETMGYQYEPFCRFARNFGEVELCAEVGGRAEKLLRGEVVDGRLVETPSSQDLEIFRPFYFPLIHLSKLDMLATATQRGYDQVLRKTWSCWFPRRSGGPCGRCEMCRQRVQPHPAG